MDGSVTNLPIGAVKPLTLLLCPCLGLVTFKKVIGCVWKVQLVYYTRHKRGEQENARLVHVLPGADRRNGILLT